MILRFTLGVIVASAFVIHTTVAVGAEGTSMSALEKSYLHKATEGQHAEVALGQLAVQRASSDRVKQFGALMIQDHKRIREELQTLTSKEGPLETGELSMPHQQIQRMLARLSGKEFDKAYMAFMVREHTQELDEWQQRVVTVTDARVERTMAALLPVLKEHLEQGRTIAAAIGVTAEDLAKVDEATSPSKPF